MPAYTENRIGKVENTNIIKNLNKTMWDFYIYKQANY
jgi:hypothetical protein